MHVWIIFHSLLVANMNQVVHVIGVIVMDCINLGLIFIQCESEKICVLHIPGIS